MIVDENYEYNKEPLIYCEKCLSLMFDEVKVNGKSIYQCSRCGNRSVRKDNTFNYSKRHKAKYGKTIIAMTKEEIRWLNKAYENKIFKI